MIHRNKKLTREVLETKLSNGGIQLFFNYLYKREDSDSHGSYVSSDCVDRKTYSKRSRKMADKKIQGWLGG